MRKIRRGLCRKSQEIDFEASSATGGYDGVLVEELDYPAELRRGLMTVTQTSAVYHVAVDGVWQLGLHNPATTATVIEASTNLDRLAVSVDESDPGRVIAVSGFRFHKRSDAVLSRRDSRTIMEEYKRGLEDAAGFW